MKRLSLMGWHNLWIMVFCCSAGFVEAFAHFGIEVTMEETRKPMGMLKIEHIRTMTKMKRIAKLWEEKYGRSANDADMPDDL